MPRDYDLNAMSVSGLASGKGKGKIAGMPQGVHPSVPLVEKWLEMKADKQGAIVGSPVGIKGTVRSPKLDAMARYMKG